MNPLHPYTPPVDMDFLATLSGADIYVDCEGDYFLITGETPPEGWYVNGRFLASMKHPRIDNFPEPFLSFCLAHHNLIS